MPKNKINYFIFLNRILDYFKLRCPKCRGKLTEDFTHEFWGGGEINGYTCKKCKTQWINNNEFI